MDASIGRAAASFVLLALLALFVLGSVDLRFHDSGPLTTSAWGWDWSAWTRAPSVIGAVLFSSSFAGALLLYYFSKNLSLMWCVMNFIHVNAFLVFLFTISLIFGDQLQLSIAIVVVAAMLALMLAFRFSFIAHIENVATLAFHTVYCNFIIVRMCLSIAVMLGCFLFAIGLVIIHQLSVDNREDWIFIASVLVAMWASHTAKLWVELNSSVIADAWIFDCDDEQVAGNYFWRNAPIAALAAVHSEFDAACRAVQLVLRKETFARLTALEEVPSFVGALYSMGPTLTLSILCGVIVQCATYMFKNPLFVLDRSILSSLAFAWSFLVLDVFVGPVRGAVSVVFAHLCRSDPLPMQLRFEESSSRHCRAFKALRATLESTSTIL